jgi:hypothetical protein
MAFAITQTRFPSTTHRSIWHAALFLAPFQGIPSHDAGQAGDLREGEANLVIFRRVHDSNILLPKDNVII